MKKVYVHINKARVSVEVEDDIFDAIDMLIKTEHALERRERYHRAYHIESCQYHGQELSDTEDVLAMLAAQQRWRLIKAALLHMPPDQQKMIIWLINGIKIADIAIRYGVDDTTMLQLLERAVDDLIDLINIIK